MAKHRVVVIRQRADGSEVRELVSRWMTPDAAEVESDREAQRVAEDPARYVSIESKGAVQAEVCEL